MVIVSATRDGARAGSIACGTDTPPCSSDITTRVNGAIGGLNRTSFSVTCRKPDTTATSCDSGLAKEGGSITVSATYRYHMIWPLAFGTEIPDDRRVQVHGPVGGRGVGTALIMSETR